MYELVENEERMIYEKLSMKKNLIYILLYSIFYSDYDTIPLSIRLGVEFLSH